MFYLLTLVVALSRLLPHPPNVACIGALGLFAGCYLAGKRAYFVPLVAIAVSDVIGHLFRIPGMGFYHPLSMAMVYLAVVTTVPIGRLMQRHQSLLRYPAGSLAASSTFFLISNFGVWLGPWYPTSGAGLLACYTSAIPFFGYTIAGDLIFTAILFGSWEFSRRISQGRKTIRLSRFARSERCPAYQSV